MEEALTALLRADPALTGVVGNRIHWDVLPAHVAGRPYLALTIVDAPDDNTYGGTSNYAAWDIQADIWAATAGGAIAGDRALRALLSGYRGVTRGIRFQGIFITRGRSGVEPDIGGDGQLHRRSLDLNIHWNQE